jgi:hypothetical protein
LRCAPRCGICGTFPAGQNRTDQTVIDAGIEDRMEKSAIQEGRFFTVL